MRRKITLCLLFLTLLTLLWSIVYGENLSPVTGLKAEGKLGHVVVTWNKVNNAQGYLVFRKVGSTGSLTYSNMTSNLSYTDKTASAKVFNFYRVYPYKNVNGKRVTGPSTSYTYAKAKEMESIQGIWATGGYKKVTLRWNRVLDADGYYIYSRAGNTGAFSYLGLTSGHSYSDTKASTEEMNFYLVQPFKVVNGLRVSGPMSRYVYGKAYKVPPVSGLKATSESNRVKLTWNPVSGVDGYMVYRKIGPLGTFTYLYMINTAGYIDTSASAADNNYYRVYPFKTENGKRILGPSTNYVFSKATDPNGSYETDLAQELLKLINNYRVDLGLNALVETYESRQRAQESVKLVSESFYHTGLETNIARYYPSAKSCLEAWKRSPGHHYGMLNERDKYIGVGCYVSDIVYWSFSSY